MRPDDLQSYHRFMREHLFAHVDIPAGSDPHPGRHGAARGGRACGARVRGGDRRRRRDRLPAPRHREDRTRRLQRARIRPRQPHPAGHPRPDHAPGGRRRLLRRGERADGGGHDGRRDDPRGARDRDPRHRRAQGPDRAPGRRGRGGCGGGGDVPPGASEHDVLPRSRGGGGAHPRGDAVAGGRGRVDSRARGARGHLAVGADPEGDPQAHPPRLRRGPALLAGRAPRLRRRGQRAGLQRARRQDPRALEAAARRAHHLLLARIPTTTSSRWAACSTSWSRTATRSPWRT